MVPALELKRYVIQRDHKSGLALIMTQEYEHLMFSVISYDERTTLDNLLHYAEWPSLHPYAMLENDAEILSQPHGLSFLACTVLRRSIAVANRLADTLSGNKASSRR